MAIYNGRILMRKGNEADFDAEKLMPGEWAVSLDKGIVRICLEVGKVIRMATYEAFEEDMKQVEAILLECQSIEEAVRRINTEVNNKLNACAEYVQQAKGYSEQAEQYRDEALQFRNEAENFTPSGYAEIVEQVNKNTFKIDTVIEKADLGIKNTANGKEIHLVDSADAKIIETTLYGESQQNQYSGTQLFDRSSAVIGAEFFGSDGSPTTDNSVSVTTIQCEPSANYTVSDMVGGQYARFNYLTEEGSFISRTLVTVSQGTVTFTTPQTCYKMQIAIDNSMSQLMLVKGSVALPYEPYVGGTASPSPSYPQEIESVEVSEIKSVGKNLYNNTIETKTSSGITLTKNEDGSMKLTGTPTLTSGSVVFYDYKTTNFLKPNTEYIFTTGNAVKGNSSILLLKKHGLISQGYILVCSIPYNGKSKTFSFTKEQLEEYPYMAIGCGVVYSEKNVDVTLYHMIRLASVENDTYEPYKESKVTLSTPITLRGIGDVKDVLCKQDGVYGVLNGIKQYTFTSIRSLLSSTNTVRLFIDVSDNVGGQLELMCNALQVKNIYDKDESGVMYVPTSKVFVIRLPKSVLTDETTATILKYLQDNVVLHYKCSPTFEPLPEADNEQIENLLTFYPITNISNDGEGEMSVKYLCDSKNYVDNQLAEMEKAREQAMMEMLLLLPEETQATMIENDVNNLLTESES